MDHAAVAVGDTLAMANETVRYDGRHIDFVVPKNKIVLDGQLDEWAGVAGVNIDSPANLVSDHWLYNWWRGKADLSATVYFQYDNDYLYVAFRVLDDKVMPGDSIEFRFDRNNYLSPNEKLGFAGKLQIKAAPPQADPAAADTPAGPSDRSGCHLWKW